MTRVDLRSFALAVLVVAGLGGASVGCRAISTSKPSVAAWTAGAPVIVVPRSVKLPLVPDGTLSDWSSDVEAASYVAKALGDVGKVQVLTPAPGAVIDSRYINDDELCLRARDSGARYLVEASTIVSVEHEFSCWLSNGILRHLKLPLIIPFTEDYVVVDNPLGVKEGCLLEADLGWSWAKQVEARVIDVSTCSPTGAKIKVWDSGKSKTQPPVDLMVLHERIDVEVTQLFPDQIVVEEVSGGHVIAKAAGVRKGDIYQGFRPGQPAAGDALAYASEVKGDQVRFEPYGSGLRFHKDDILVSRGQIQWAEVLPHGAVGTVLAGNEWFVTRGGGFRISAAFDWLMLAFEGEYLTLHDQDARARVNLNGVLNFGVGVGYIHHLLPRLDLYAFVGGGASHVVAERPKSDGSGFAPYVSPRLGAKISLGRLLIDVQAGATLTPTYWDRSADHVAVRQLGPVARIAIGYNYWP